MSKKMYIPPEVWKWESDSGGTFSKTNRPIAGATHEKKLPVGKHPLQLYSLATPNGVKITVMLEELLALGFEGAEYDAWLVKIDGNQFGSGFVELNPNSKIPTFADHSSGSPIRIFESGAIMLYLAEKFDALIPKNVEGRAEMLSWLFWQMSSAPYLGGGFGHFYAYAPEKFEYPINRYAMEVKRQLDVLDRNLSEREFICGGDYNIADIAIWAWYGQLVLGRQYNSSKFLDVSSYTHVCRWASAINARPAVKRGRMVNKTSGRLEMQLHERHDASDFETKTQDNIK